jgi:hypothetical protein
MVAPGVFKHQETELEREMRIFDEEEATVNAEVLAAARAHQAEERARLARLRGEVARPGGSGDNVADPSRTREEVAGPSKAGDAAAESSESEDGSEDDVATSSDKARYAVGAPDPSPAEFLKSWKKIGSVSENKQWNGLVRKVRNSSC